MEHALAKIYGKSSDYVLCPKCNKINWYENKECIRCGASLRNARLDKEEFYRILDNIYKEYKEEGFEEGEIDNIEVEV